MDTRVAVIVLAALLIGAAFHGARAGCCVADPSALDLRPGSPPLSVARDPAAAELVFTWERHSSDSQIWQGDLDELWANDRLDDESVAQTTESELRLPEPAGDHYFLVSGWCHDLHCTRGRDSFGVERRTPGCEILERGTIWAEPALCLGLGQGVVRDALEYDAFAACFSAGTAPAPLQAGEALLWKTDHSNAACGSCLEFSFARRLGDELVAEARGLPFGECDAIHDGGVWARVPSAPILTIREEMPPFPEYSVCY